MELFKEAQKLFALKGLTFNPPGTLLKSAYILDCSVIYKLSYFNFNVRKVSVSVFFFNLIIFKMYFLDIVIVCIYIQYIQ